MSVNKWSKWNEGATDELEQAGQKATQKNQGGKKRDKNEKTQSIREQRRRDQRQEQLRTKGPSRWNGVTGRQATPRGSAAPRVIIEAVRLPREAAQSAQGTIKKAEGEAPSRVQSDKSKPSSYSREGARRTVRGSAASSSHRQKRGAIRSRGRQGIPHNGSATTQVNVDSGKTKARGPKT